jgi:hypothetical protein
MHQKEVLIAHSRTDINARPPLISQYPCAPAKTSAVFRANFAAGGAGEVRLDVRKPDLIGPAVGADRDMVAASLIRGRHGRLPKRISF